MQLHLVSVYSVNFLNKEKILSGSGAKCILCLNGLLLTYNIILFFHLQSVLVLVDRVDLLLLRLHDKLWFYEVLFIILIFFGIVMKDAVIFSKECFCGE